MGLFSWLFGGDKAEEQVKMDAGMHHMQPASEPMAGMQAGGEMHMQHSGAMSGMKTAKDPVCGMSVSPENAAATSVHQGTTYYFCAPGCKKSFDQNPAKYLGGSRQMENGMHRGCC